MPATLTLNSFLHNTSLLLHAYPASRITTKYSLPRLPSPRSKKQQDAGKTTAEDTSVATDGATKPEKKEPSATLTVKVFHPQTGICLKYSTDKAQEVGRLITSLGRLARGEKIDLPSSGVAGGAEGAEADKMEVDSGPQVAVKDGDAVVTGKPSGGAPQQPPAKQAGGGGGGGGGKKKKGKGKR